MWFSHPKPFITKAVAMQMAEQKALPPPDTTTIVIEHEDVSIPELRQQVGTVAEGAAPIRISVALQLREYLDFRWANARSKKTRMRLPDTVAGAGSPDLLIINVNRARGRMTHAQVVPQRAGHRVRQTHSGFFRTSIRPSKIEIFTQL